MFLHLPEEGIYQLQLLVELDIQKPELLWLKIDLDFSLAAVEYLHEVVHSESFEVVNPALLLIF